MDNGCLTRAVFLDLTKAFDTINHSLLLEKLSNLGVDDGARTWFTSFLTNRKQVTNCNDVCSDGDPISIGVAQGSILGPLLFIIDMNDLPTVLEFCRVTLEKDDTILYFALKSAMDLESESYFLAWNSIFSFQGPICV